MNLRPRQWVRASFIYLADFSYCFNEQLLLHKCWSHTHKHKSHSHPHRALHDSRLKSEPALFQNIQKKFLEGLENYNTNR